MNEFLTWEFLGTFAGAATATGFLTQFVKKFIPQVAPQLISYVIALFLLLAAAFFTGTLTVSSAVLTVMNAVAVSLAANGGYDAVKNVTNKASSK